VSLNPAWAGRYLVDRSSPVQAWSNGTVRSSSGALPHTPRFEVRGAPGDALDAVTVGSFRALSRFFCRRYYVGLCIPPYSSGYQIHKTVGQVDRVLATQDRQTCRCTAATSLIIAKVIELQRYEAMHMIIFENIASQGESKKER